MTRREVREDQHGTTTGYSYGCRCEICCAAASASWSAWYEVNRERELEKDRAWIRANRDDRNEYNRAYHKANRATISARKRAYRSANRGYLLEDNRQRMRLIQDASLARATQKGAPWQPHEDALLGRIASDIAAASALSRTVRAVASRRHKLKFLRRSAA